MAWSLSMLLLPPVAHSHDLVHPPKNRPTAQDLISASIPFPANPPSSDLSASVSEPCAARIVAHCALTSIQR